MKYMVQSLNHPVFYTVGSFLMAVFASNLSLILIGVCMRSRKMIYDVGYKILLIFLALTFIRFAIPFDLPFSVSVSLPFTLSDVLSFIHIPVVGTQAFSLSVWQIVKIVWFSVAGIMLLCYLYKVRRSNRFLRRAGLDISRREPYASFMDEICRERGKKNHFHVVRIQGIHVPKIYGVFRPYILIPVDFEIGEKDLYYVLYHEASHYFHRDLLVKTCIQILCMFYWWNPFSYVFKRQAGLLLEMQVDDKVIRGDRARAYEYLECLIDVKEKLEGGDSPDEESIPDSLLVSFIKGDRGELERRFEMITGSGNKRKTWVNSILAVLMLSIFYLSYQFTFEALYRPYVINEGNTKKYTMIFPQADELYAIENEDGTYSIYCEYGNLNKDWFIEKVDDIKNRIMIKKIYYLEKGQYKE